MADFNLVIDKTLQNEGGSKITNDFSDSGGWTKYGITLGALKSANEDLNGDGVVDKNDVISLTEDQAKAFYKKHYWDTLSLDSLNSQGVASKVFDIGVNTGIGTAAKFLQQAVGVVVDGSIGPKTIQAANSQNEVDVMNKLVGTQQYYYWSIVESNINRKANIPVSSGGLGWSEQWIALGLQACHSKDLSKVSQLLSTIKAAGPGHLPGNIKFIQGWLNRSEERFGL